MTICILVKETKRQGRIAHHLYVSAAMPPFRTSWLYLASPLGDAGTGTCHETVGSK